MKALRIKLDAAGEEALGGEGLTLGDLIWLLVFGDRRETPKGLEMTFHRESIANRLGPRAAEEMLHLEGVVILLSGGRIVECRRNAGTNKSEGVGSDVRMEE